MGRKSRAKKAAASVMALVTGSEPTPETPISDAVVEDAVIETALAALEASAGEPVAAPIAELPTDVQDFDSVLASVSNEDVDAKLAATVAAIDERADFEKVKDASNTKIQKTIGKVRSQICTKRAARLLCATNVDPTILNRSLHDGARYNVYAMGKLSDVIYGLTNADDGVKGAIRNSINLACMRSLFHFRAAGVQFTGELAKCAASDKIRVEHAVKAMLVRHTVAASTAPTQASSTMQALETLGIVRRSGSSKNPNFDLTSNPIVGKLEKALAA